jgi:hypothetical protein
VLAGHQSAVNSAIFSPSGDRIVTVSSDGTARLWDSRTGAVLAILKHESDIWYAAFNPSGDQVATSSADGTLCVWDVRTGAVLTQISAHDAEINSVQFSPSGDQILSTSDDQTARLWSPRTGAMIATLKGHEARVRSAAFNPSGDLVVTGSDDKTARLWKTIPHVADNEAIPYARLAATRYLSHRERRALFLDEAHLPMLAPQMDPCDAVAGDPEDREAVGPSVPFDSLDADKAVVVCQAALSRNPREPRYFYQLARALLKSAPSPAAITAFRQAADMGYGAAFGQLGRLYWDGNGVTQDHAEALRVWQKGAAQGNARSHAHLAELYERGDGVQLARIMHNISQ